MAAFDMPAKGMGTYAEDDPDRHNCCRPSESERVEDMLRDAAHYLSTAMECNTRAHGLAAGLKALADDFRGREWVRS